MEGSELSGCTVHEIAAIINDDSEVKEGGGGTLCTWSKYRYMTGNRVEGGTDTRDERFRNRLVYSSIG